MPTKKVKQVVVEEVTPKKEVQKMKLEYTGIHEGVDVGEYDVETASIPAVPLDTPASFPVLVEE